MRAGEESAYWRKIDSTPNLPDFVQVQRMFSWTRQVGEEGGFSVRWNLNCKGSVGARIHAKFIGKDVFGRRCLVMLSDVQSAGISKIGQAAQPEDRSKSLWKHAGRKINNQVDNLRWNMHAACRRWISHRRWEGKICFQIDEL